jgi:hypothetical protein
MSTTNALYPALSAHAHDLLTIQTLRGSGLASDMEVQRRQSTSEIRGK